MDKRKKSGLENSKGKVISKTSPKDVEKAAERDFPIVGIGASAGGLDALELFFGKVPNNTGMAFIVIQHLDPNHAGIMPELLQRITPMKVFQASDNLKVKPDCVYVIPPNKSLSILNGSLHLFDPVETRGLRLPVDIFFRSLAVDKMDKSIGIILSGMGSDGSLGLKAIKEKSGIVLVQDPETAKFDGMPRSALKAVHADIVAPAEELPSRLASFIKYLPAGEADPEYETKTRGSLDKIIILLRDFSGHDFSLYKKSTLIRRIERRKGVHQIDKLTNYVRFLQENPAEVEILFKELLIGVTNFFRDASVWNTLKEKVFPAMLDELPDGYVLRAWVVGCSTGEEAYSLAMIFHEAAEQAKMSKKLSLQIFATDLDADAIEIARKGVFPANILADVSPERISRFFTVQGEGYRLNASIREMVVFALQNVIKDPPFTKLDFLSCRNLLIYMEHPLQEKLMALFQYSLNPGGIMLLGSAETPGNLKEAFFPVDARMKIYKRMGTPVMSDLIDFPSAFNKKGGSSAGIKRQPKVEANIQILAENILLQRFAPPSVLVNNQGEILYLTGRTGKYLEPVAGKANWNIYAMLRDGLRQAVPGALRQAQKNFVPVVVRNVKVGTNGGTQLVDVTVQRIDSPDPIRGLLMVVFADVKNIPDRIAEGVKKGTPKPGSRLAEVELELQRSSEDLQSTREEMQTSQEELKSTNEELQSTNEELQSTNEELTTSKEEMQSMNEELQTLNAELQSKLSDFIRANDDMKNLLNSTEIATLFLDKNLNIRRFTDPTTNIFKLRNSDIGRPFTDLVTDLKYPDMDKQARQVIKTLISVETAVETRDGRWFQTRIIPYRTIDDRIDGLVMTFTDISLAKKLESELKNANEILRNQKGGL